MVRRYRRRRNPGPFAAVIALVTVLLLLYLLFNTQLLPVMKSLALNQAKVDAVNCMNDAVGAVLSKDRSAFDSLVKFEKDSGGRITAVRTDSFTANLLKYDIIRECESRLEKLTTSEMAIPLGNVLGGPVFTNRGPPFHAQVSPYGNVTAEFENVFSAAGINQTRLQIKLNISTYVSVIIASFASSTKVNTSLIVSETVVVGTVPDTYLGLGDADAGNAALIAGAAGGSSGK